MITYIYRSVRRQKNFLQEALSLDYHSNYDLYSMTLARLSLALRNFFFVVLQPGTVAGLVPYIIAKNEFRNAFSATFRFHHYLGILILLTGLLIMLHCVVKFAVDGLGTLSPADPTKRLVISGLYKFSRNPMYVGIIMILTGEVVLSGSVHLLFYSIGVFILFHLFVKYMEEPRLQKDFGQEYVTYCRTVRRWL